MDKEKLWWIVGALVAAMASLLTYWQTAQDKDIDANTHGVGALREERHDIIREMKERDLIQDQEMKFLQHRIEKNEQRIDYAEKHNHEMDPGGVNGNRW